MKQLYRMRLFFPHNRPSALRDSGLAHTTLRRFSIGLSLLLCVIGLAMLAGCDLAKPQGGAPEQPPAVAEPTTEPAEEVPAESAEEANTAEKPAEAIEETVKIEQGFTGKGQYGQGAGDPSDIITVPIGALFSTRERMFMMQLKHTEDLYKASNDSQMPKTHEEYMEKIVKEGGLTLPQLPDNQEYFYDPESQELMIKKPR